MQGEPVDIPTAASKQLRERGGIACGYARHQGLIGGSGCLGNPCADIRYSALRRESSNESVTVWHMRTLIAAIVAAVSRRASRRQI